MNYSNLNQTGNKDNYLLEINMNILSKSEQKF